MRTEVYARLRFLEIQHGSGGDRDLCAAGVDGKARPPASLTSEKLNTSPASGSFAVTPSQPTRRCRACSSTVAAAGAMAVGASFTLPIVIAITIGNVNEAPTAIAPAAATVDEQAHRRHIGCDGNDRERPRCRRAVQLLAGQRRGQAHFAIDASSAQITVAPGAVLDFEIRSRA